MRARLIIGGLLLPVWLFTLAADVMAVAADLPPRGMSMRFISAVAVKYAFYAVLAYPVFYVTALIVALWLKEKGRNVVAVRVATIPLLVPFLPFGLGMFASIFRN